MCNRSYSYLDENKLLFKNQFGFSHGHSTGHTRFELTEQISESSNRNNNILGIFIALQQPLTQQNTNIILKITLLWHQRKTLTWFLRYLSNRKQFIKYDERNIKTDFLDITCGVPKGLIFGSFPFYHFCVSNQLQFINILQMTQTYFLQMETLRIYFKKPKMKFPNLIKFPNGFVQKTKYTIFHKPQIKDKLPLQLPILSFNNYEIERSSNIKFVGKMVDEHLNQKGFINTLGNKKIFST